MPIARRVLLALAALALATGGVTAGPSKEQAISAEVELARLFRTSSGLKYLDLRPGRGAEARKGAVLEVHYTGWLSNGKKFDSSRDRNVPFIFTLGAGHVIKGFDEGFSGMKVGGKRKLVIPPQLGYGARGAGNVIPPNAELTFEVELLRIK
jgi:FKBP-type peptidyl-prolyl cis-trans isomerase FkpA